MKVAIVIAVEQYADSRIARAPYAAADGVAFAQVLEPLGFAAADRVLLVDGDATKTVIESKVRRAIKSLEADDQLFVYYAGQSFSAGEQNFITCHDTQRSDLEATSLPLDWLLRQLGGCDCRQMVLLFDTGDRSFLSRDEMVTAGQDSPDAELSSELIESEFVDHFGDSGTSLALVAARSNQVSHASGALQHGIWAHHLIEALDGRAPLALESGSLVTVDSLQKHLLRALPRTLALTFDDKREQTPWACGGASKNFVLADLTKLLADRKATADPHAGKYQQIRFVAYETVPLKRLSGYRKTNTLPDEVNSRTQAFVANLADKEITDDLDKMYARLKSNFRFKRADVDVAEPHDGGGSILTPYFSYAIQVAIDPGDLSQAIFTRTVSGIKDPNQIGSEAAAAVFEGMFNTLEFESPERVDLGALIDRFEEQDDDRIELDYDRDITYCKVQIAGLPGEIRVTAGAISVVQPKTTAPKNLLFAFLQFQNALADTHGRGMIRFG